MSFLLFALIAIGALGLLAALLSIGDSDSPVVHGDHDCASCTSHDDGSCKIACMMEESRRRKEEKARVAASADTEGDDGDDGNCVTDVHSDESDENTDDASDDRPSATDRLPLTPIILLLAILVAASCSTQRNNSQTRMWHAFNARYNTYSMHRKPLSKDATNRNAAIETTIPSCCQSMRWATSRAAVSEQVILTVR